VPKPQFRSGYQTSSCLSISGRMVRGFCGGATSVGLASGRGCLSFDADFRWARVPPGALVLVAIQRRLQRQPRSHRRPVRRQHMRLSE
jgi:hypothetical protein